MKKLLLQCGFSEQKADNFLKELKISNPDGEINLANFFQKTGELDPAGNKQKKMKNRLV